MAIGDDSITPDADPLPIDWKPRFVRRYAEMGKTVGAAFKAYADDVRAGRFPSAAESYD